ncbi:MAG: hypothetical protein KDK99_14690 [Verrucomicrobiales bacterium]|nr:hypothetical protein [Verrucomicrobiales bacterium]
MSQRVSVLAAALTNDESAVEAALLAEELLERQNDRNYWKPLRTELEAMLRGR